MSSVAAKRAEKCKSIALKLASADVPDHLRILRFLRKSLSLEPSDSDLPDLISHHEDLLSSQLAPSLPSPTEPHTDYTPTPPPTTDPDPAPEPHSTTTTTTTTSGTPTLVLSYPHLSSILSQHHKVKVFTLPVAQRIPDPHSPYALPGPLYHSESTDSCLESYGYCLKKIGSSTDVVDWKVVQLTGDSEEEEEEETEEKKGFEWISQAHYDWVGRCVAFEVREKVFVDTLGLKVSWVLPDGSITPREEGVGTFGVGIGHEMTNVSGVSVLHSEGLFTQDTQDDTPLLVIVQGAGVVRCGLWGLRKTVNQSVRAGTALEYVERGLAMGWRILLLNPNHNYAYVEQEEEEEEGESHEMTATTDDSIPQQSVKAKKKFQIVPILGHRDPYEHVRTVFDALRKSPAGGVGRWTQHILVVAHSFGGCVILEDLLLQRPEIVPHLAGLALTDSVHDKALVERLSVVAIRFLKHNARNWAKSDMQLNERMVSVPFSLAELQTKTPEEIIECRSAGTDEHDMTSQMSCNYVFQYLDICFHCGARLSDDPAAILQYATEVKQEGNNSIRAKNVSGARLHYLKGLMILTERLRHYRDGIILDESTVIGRHRESDEQVEPQSSPLPNDFPQQIEKLVQTFRANMALVELRLKNYQDVVTYASLVLAVDKRNGKCLLRRGIAYFQLRNYDKAKDSLVDAHAVLPDDRQVMQYLRAVRKALRERSDAERIAYGQMFK